MSDILTPTQIQEATEALLLSGAWELAEGEAWTFAGGQPANNKFHADRPLEAPESIRNKVLQPLGELVTHLGVPDALWGPPTGGQEYAKAIGERYDIPVIVLEKDIIEPGRRTYVVAEESRALAEGAETLVGIEDLTNRMTSTYGALQTPVSADSTITFDEKTLFMTAVVRRGTPEVERTLPVPIFWVVELPTPDLITPDHPVYQQFAHLAVKAAAS